MSDHDPGEPIALSAITAAADVLTGAAVETPVHRSPAVDDQVGARVFVKDESRQRTGSFKFRGAYHRLSAIPQHRRHRGVVAVSSGNHGAAVACAAELLGMPAVIHVPEDVAPAKRDRMVGCGAELVTFDPVTADREGPARAHAADIDAVFVHPFEDPLVMAGQGTVALELHREVGALDALVVPMSGGGLMAGCASAMHALDPTCVLIGVEPSDGDDTQRSFAAGETVLIDAPQTIADGLRVRRPGEVTFAINRHLVREVMTVTEDQIVEAMLALRGQLGVMAEPSGAVALAAVVAESDRFRSQRVGVLLSGGNIDPARFSALTGWREG